MPSESANGAAATHSVRAVTRLTGLSAHILRIWEKRYGAVQPTRTGTGRRVYTTADVERFSLLKNLLGQGHAIGHIARLPDSKLRELWQSSDQMRDQLEARPAKVRLVLCGGDWAARQKSLPLHLEGIEVVGVVGTLGELSSLGERSADALLLEEPHPDLALVTQLTAWIEKLGLQRIIIVYRFAGSRVLARLKKNVPGLCVLRAPVSDDEIRLACLLDGKGNLSLPQTALENTPEKPRSFTPAELERLANYSTSLACDCPKHLVELIRSLDSFETYSANCSSRDAEDAALHQRLQKRTAQARSMMEEALRDLVTVEKLS